jgi:lipopolysaccharide/colanic/teichoic acid biosynthesis glycosyltransferase
MSGKRLFDLVLALMLALPAILLCALCAAVIFAECRANPLFRQVRLGRNKQPFTLYKLRTMAPGTRQGTSHDVGAATILRSGGLLRRLKIDELPQVWNILKGEMSFIGPRPGLPGDARLTEARDAQGVFALMPGITGPAQLAGLDMSTPVELAANDAHYLGPWSLGRDVALLLQTVGGRGYRDASKA